jgi:sulfide:quinone oxidoreductase
VTTDAGVHEADYLVIALGAEYDLAATPGLAEVDSEFYSVDGARKLAAVIPEFAAGRALIGVCGAPFKCPPAPSECALLLDDELRRRGVREACEIAGEIRDLQPALARSDGVEGKVRQRPPGALVRLLNSAG